MTPLSESLLESVAAAAVREGLADAIFTRLATPIGRLLVVQGPEGLVRIAFEGEAEDRVLAEVARALGPNIIGSDRELATERDALSAYLEGDNPRAQWADRIFVGNSLTCQPPRRFDYVRTELV